MRISRLVIDRGRRAVNRPPPSDQLLPHTVNRWQRRRSGLSSRLRVSCSTSLLLSLVRLHEYLGRLF